MQTQSCHSWERNPPVVSHHKPLVSRCLCLVHKPPMTCPSPHSLSLKETQQAVQSSCCPCSCTRLVLCHSARLLTSLFGQPHFSSVPGSLISVPSLGSAASVSSLLACTVGHNSPSKRLLASAFLFQSLELWGRGSSNNRSLPTFSTPSPGAAPKSLVHKNTFSFFKLDALWPPLTL